VKASEDRLAVKSGIVHTVSVTVTRNELLEAADGVTVM
jgi:hypothetical protein